MSITVSAPAGYAIEPIDPATASRELEVQVVALWHALEREQVPEDPERPDAVIAAQFRVRPELREERHWGAFAAGGLVGTATMRRNRAGSNLHHRDVGVNVLADHRRRGLGRALFATVIADIGDGDDIVVNGWTSSRVPSGEAFAERVGAKAGLRMVTNQLDLAKVDRPLMEQWARLDPTGYRVEQIDGDIPDRLMENAIVAFRAMNTMPRGDLEMEDWVMTPEIIRDRERVEKERGQRHWLLLAIHQASGGTAAFTEIGFDPRSTHAVWQRGTATIPEHRGRGLGKWIKARNLLRILNELPDARFIRTNNAGTNAPMLSINERMGFRRAWENAIWQLSLADAWRYVRS